MWKINDGAKVFVALDRWLLMCSIGRLTNKGSTDLDLKMCDLMKRDEGWWDLSNM